MQTIDDIQDTVQYFLANNLDSLFTVKKEQVQSVFKNKPINFDEQGKFAQTQDLTPVCPFVPFMMMWKTSTFIEEYDKTGYAFFSGKVGYFPVSRLSSIIIKYEEDFRMAEMLIESNKKGLKEIEYYRS